MPHDAPNVTARSVWKTLSRRAIGAALLNASVYKEVVADRKATGQAVGLVLVASVLGELRWLLSNDGPWATLGWMLWSLLASLLFFVFYTLLTFVAARLQQGKGSFGGLFRAIGFAHAIWLLVILQVLPLIGWVIPYTLSILVWVATIIAIREAMHLSTRQAVGTGVLGMLVFLLPAIAAAIAFPEAFKDFVLG